MKLIQIFLYSLLALLAAAYSALSAEPVPGIAPETPNGVLTGFSVSPYYTVAFQDFDGNSREGAGLEFALPLSKTVSIVTYAESDSWQHAAIDRAGLGLQLTGKLGRLKPFGRLGFGYTWDAGSGIAENAFYLRPQFGTTLPFYTKGNFEAGLTASWALDVSMEGRTSQRLFGGLGFSYKF